MERRFLGYQSSLTLACLTLAVQAQSISAEPENRQLEEIVVTAQKREENLQDVPVSVAAFSGDGMAAKGIDNMQELGQMVPSLAISNAVGFTITHLRGVGSSAIGPGLEPPVAIYLDGVYYASTTSSLFDFANVERVEVLKGPQGTLFGRNATGGLVQAFTRDPGDEFEARGEVGYGNYETTTGNLYIAGPISDTVAVDIAIVAGTQGKGWGTNLATGDDIYDNDHNLTLRSKWVVTPSDSTRLVFAGDYSDSKNSYNGQRAPEGSLTLPVLGYGEQGGDAWDQNGNITPEFTNENYGVSFKFEHDLESYAISNLMAWRNSETNITFDIDFTPVPHLDGTLLVDNEEQFSNEFQISSLDGERLNWTAGLFYFWAEGAYDPSGVCFCNAPTSPFGPATALASYGTQDTTAYSGFAQGTYDISEASHVTLGARYNYEKREVDGETLADFGVTGNYIPLGDPYQDSLDFEDVSYRLALDHQFTDDLMGYVSFNTGFKSGGFNTQSITDPFFLPEELDAYEIGLKSTLFDGQLRLNAAAYYYDYTNIQVQKVSLATTGIINGAAAAIQGVEFEFEGVAGDNFSYGGSLGYIDSEFDEFEGAPFGPPAGTFAPSAPGDASGNELPKTPHFQGTLYANWAMALANAGSLDLNLVYSYNSGYFLEADNVFPQDSFNKINATAKWTAPDEHWSVKLWGKNLLNEEVMNYNSTLGDGSRNASYEAPRTYGVTLGYVY